MDLWNQRKTRSSINDLPKLTSEPVILTKLSFSTPCGQKELKCCSFLSTSSDYLQPERKLFLNSKTIWTVIKVCASYVLHCWEILFLYPMILLPIRTRLVKMFFYKHSVYNLNYLRTQNTVASKLLRFKL